MGADAARSGEMAINWSEYLPFDPGVDRPLHEVTGREARAAFNRVMAARPERRDQLSHLLQVNGQGALDPSDEGIQRLNDWFRREVKGDPSTGRLLPIWYAVVNDVSLFLGDVMIDRCPELKWTLHKWGVRDVSFQRHVISGFTKVANPKYSADIDLLVAIFGHRVVAQESVDPHEFVTWVQAAEAKA